MTDPRIEIIRVWFAECLCNLRAWGNEQLPVCEEDQVRELLENLDERATVPKAEREEPEVISAIRQIAERPGTPGVMIQLERTLNAFRSAQVWLDRRQPEPARAEEPKPDEPSERELELEACLRDAMSDFFDEGTGWTRRADVLLGTALASQRDILESDVREWRRRATEAEAERDQLRAELANATQTSEGLAELVRQRTKERNDAEAELVRLGEERIAELARTSAERARLTCEHEDMSAELAKAQQTATEHAGRVFVLEGELAKAQEDIRIGKELGNRVVGERDKANVDLEWARNRVRELSAELKAERERARRALDYVRQAREAADEQNFGSMLFDGLSHAETELQPPPPSAAKGEDQKPPDEPAKPVAHGPGGAHFYCGACGPHVRVDEDGCCATCGEETKIEFCRCELKPVAQQDEQEERLRFLEKYAADCGMAAFGEKLTAYLRAERRGGNG